MRTVTNLHELKDGDRVYLHPSVVNPWHKSPVWATYHGGHFYWDGSNPMDGPDYYFGGVFLYIDKIELIEETDNG